MATIGGGTPFFATFDSASSGLQALSSTEQFSADESVGLLSGDGTDTFAGGVTSFQTSDAVDSVGGGSADTSFSGTDLSLAGPTADGVIDAGVTNTSSTIVMGDDTTVQLVGVAPVDLPKNTGY
jgi:hypothetical protein